MMCAAAVAEKRIGFVQQQHRVLALCIAEAFAHSLFGFAEPLALQVGCSANHQRAVELSGNVFRETGFTGAGCAVKANVARTSALKTGQ